MEMALTFNDVPLTPITYQNSPWIRAAELARALGYSDTRKITHLYERNADEFTPEMTQVIEISDVPGMGTLENLKHKARIFSLRGCHLVAMFARTPVAKAFRRWVLNVLDKLDAEQHAALSSPAADDFTGTLSITPEQSSMLWRAFRPMRRAGLYMSCAVRMGGSALRASRNRASSWRWIWRTCSRMAAKCASTSSGDAVEEGRAAAGAGAGLMLLTGTASSIRVR